MSRKRGERLPEQGRGRDRARGKLGVKKARLRESLTRGEGWRWGRKAWREKLRKDGSVGRLKAVGGLELRGKV